MITSTRLLPSKPVSSLDEYLDRGGCRALAKALSLPRREIVEVVKSSGLRGRGGGGFSTGVKWEGLLQTEPTTYLVYNGAEGEPATFKDRLLMRRNPYQLLEGLAVAAYATGVIAAYVAVKEAFEQEARAIEKAMAEMAERDLLGAVPIHLHFGPTSTCLVRKRRSWRYSRVRSRCRG